MKSQSFHAYQLLSNHNFQTLFVRILHLHIGLKFEQVGFGIDLKQKEIKTNSSFASF